jgi:hypothetical protein
MRGWYNMICWNGLDEAQQTMLIERGVLTMGNWEPRGICQNGAEIAIEWINDVAPGPRFYCAECAVKHLEVIAAQ